MSFSSATQLRKTIQFEKKKRFIIMIIIMINMQHYSCVIRIAGHVLLNSISIPATNCASACVNDCYSEDSAMIAIVRILQLASTSHALMTLCFKQFLKTSTVFQENPSKLILDL